MTKIGEVGHFWAPKSILFNFYDCGIYMKLYPIAGIKKWFKVTAFDF